MKDTRVTVVSNDIVDYGQIGTRGMNAKLVTGDTVVDYRWRCEISGGNTGVIRGKFVVHDRR